MLAGVDLLRAYDHNTSVSPEIFKVLAMVQNDPSKLYRWAAGCVDWGYHLGCFLQRKLRYVTGGVER